MAVELIALDADSRNLFVEQLKESFDAFGKDNPEMQDVPIITREEITASLEHEETEAHWALADGKRVGGVVVNIDQEQARGEIELLFVINGMKSKNIGTDLIAALENKYRNIETWTLITPYIEVRNIHFYVNKCGYSIVEFFNPKHPLIIPDAQDGISEDPDELLFRFEKKINREHVNLKTSND